MNMKMVTVVNSCILNMKGAINLRVSQLNNVIFERFLYYVSAFLVFSVLLLSYGPTSGATEAHWCHPAVFFNLPLIHTHCNQLFWSWSFEVR